MIGQSIMQGTRARLHPDSCTCDVCTEHRELTALVDHAMQRGWYVKTDVMLRIQRLEEEIHAS